MYLAKIIFSSGKKFWCPEILILDWYLLRTTYENLMNTLKEKVTPSIMIPSIMIRNVTFSIATQHDTECWVTLCPVSFVLNVLEFKSSILTLLRSKECPGSNKCLDPFLWNYWCQSILFWRSYANFSVIYDKKSFFFVLGQGYIYYIQRDRQTFILQ